MKKNRIAAAIIAGLLFCSAALYASDSETKGTLTVTITPGACWKTDRNPQFAVWVETAGGTYVTTLFVTQRAAKKNWLFAPKDGRPESLPVWYHAVGSRPVTMVAAPDKLKTDAVTSATPGTADAMQYGVLLPAGKKYIIKVEVNHSFDYNESWPKKAEKGSVQYSGVNGQPSVVYEGTLDTQPVDRGENPAVSQGKDLLRAVLVPAGTGAVTGGDGNLHNELAKLTTALQIVDTVEASWAGTK
jgi:hypothetical protein